MNVGEQIGDIISGCIRDAVVCNVAATGSDVRAAAGHPGMECIAVRKSGDLESTRAQRAAVIGLAPGSGLHGDFCTVLLRRGQNGQGAQILGDDEIARIGGTPVQGISVDALPDFGLAPGCSDCNICRNPDRHEMGFLTSQRAPVVVGDIGVHGNVYVGCIQEHGIAAVFRHLQAVGFHGDFILHAGKTGDQVLKHLEVPSGVLAGSGEHVRIVGIDAKDILRKILFAERFNVEFNGFFSCVIVQKDREFLSGIEHHLTGFTADWVGSVHPHDAAQGVHGFTAGCVGNRQGTVAPDGLLIVMTFIHAGPCFRVDQRCSVVDFFSTSGPDGHGNRVHPQYTVNRLHIGEMRGDILTLLIVNRIFADPVRRDTGVCLTADGHNLNVEVCGQAENKGVCRPGERKAVIELAGALRNQGDGPRPGPVILCSIAFALRPGFTAGKGKETVRLFNPFHQRGIALKQAHGKGIDVFCGQLGHDRGRCGSAHRRDRDQVAGRHFQQTACTVFIRIGQPGCTFQNTQLGGCAGNTVGRSGF